jgi:hypothetical protein
MHMKLLATMGDSADDGIGSIVAVDLARRLRYFGLRMATAGASAGTRQGIYESQMSGCQDAGRDSCLRSRSNMPIFRANLVTYGHAAPGVINDLHDILLDDGRLFVTNTE